MTDTVAWGILGTAKIAVTKVIPAMQRGTHSRVAAIASRDPLAAERSASALGIPRAHGSYEALLDDPGIQAVYIPLPNHLHVPWTKRALAAGKHVLCEKPIAMDAAEAESLIAARDRSGKVVAEAFMVRHAPWWQRTRALAQNGSLGEVRAIQTFFSYFLDDPGNVRNQVEIGGGGLLDIGCYAIATARYVFGAEPARVAATIDRDPAMRVDRLTSAVMEFPGARHLTFTCSTQLSAHQAVTVVGTRGRASVMIPFNAPPDAPCRLVVDDGSALGGASGVVETFAIADQYTLQGDAISRVILGLDGQAFGIEDAVANMRAIDATLRAGESGRWETV